MPTQIVIRASPKNMGLYERNLGKQFRPLVIKITTDWGRYAVRSIRAETNKAKIMWKKRFYRGWVADRVNWHTMRVHNRAPHAIFVERGRTPGKKMPPDKPIRKWVKSKGIDEAATFLIRKKIAEKGIAAKPIMTSPVVQKRLASHMKRMVSRELNKHMRRAGRNVR